MSNDGKGGGTAKQNYRLFVMSSLKRPGQRLIFSNWLAITIGRWIFAWRDLDEYELAHELTHVRQWREHGIKFIPLYFWASLTAGHGGGNRYLDNKFEREASEAAEEVKRERAAGEGQ